jgi:hypothetical protein
MDISGGLMSEQFRVVCGKCQLGAEVVTDADGNAEAVCPACGQRDKVEDAQRIAGEHYTEGVKAMLNKTMSDAARGSKVLKFKPGAPLKADSAFRWHAVK